MELDGPRYGQTIWDFGPLTTRISQAERKIDFTLIQSGYRTDVANLLMVLAQPDHPAVIEAGIVRNDGPAPTSTVYGTYVLLRTLARWGADRSLPSFGAWHQRHCDDLLADLQAGRHRQDGYGLSSGTTRLYLDVLKLLRVCNGVLPEGLSFHPWGHRTAAAIAGYEKRSGENERTPLGWDLFAPLLAGSWNIVDQWSVDIIAAVRARGHLAPHPAGPGGRNALKVIKDWDANGGRLPVHTGFGRSPGRRGEANASLLCRMLPINDSILKRANRNYRQEAADILAAAAADPARSTFGGLIIPSVEVTLEDGTRAPWVAEIGLGETEYFVSVLRAACYVVIACLTGMRDGEIQELRRGSVTVQDGLPALASIQHKGNASPMGEMRAWWAPQPAIRACEVLAAVSPHPTYLFARSATQAGSYNGDRDLSRLIAFMNGDPAVRPGRGSGLGLSPVHVTDADSINAAKIRRSFAIYATTKPGAELGLGIQLGHSAWRMTSGYFSDGQQQAVKHLDSVRKGVMRKQAAELIRDTAPVAGPAARHIDGLRAQVVADPSRADRLAETVAERYHLGITNDCMWNPNTSGCGTDRPHLNDHICVGPGCRNALLTQVHAPVLRNEIARIDTFLDKESGNQDLRALRQEERTKLVGHLRDLSHDQPTPVEE